MEMITISLPRIGGQVGLRNVLFEDCSAFTHVTACTLAKSPSDPLHRRLQPLRYLHDCSDCFRLEQHRRVGFAPTEKRRLCTAHARTRHSRFYEEGLGCRNSGRSAQRRTTPNVAGLDPVDISQLIRLAKLSDIESTSLRRDVQHQARVKNRKLFELCNRFSHHSIVLIHFYESYTQRLRRQLGPEVIN